jgi:hypothetical protein
MLHKSVDRIFVALASDGDLDLCSLFVKPYQILHSDTRDPSTIQVKGKTVHKEQWTEVREWLFSSESINPPFSISVHVNTDAMLDQCAYGAL